MSYLNRDVTCDLINFLVAYDCRVAAVVVVAVISLD